jgi:hypothetical protein
MGLSLGWLLFLGGALGTVRVLRAKTFSWANEVDTVVTEEDRKREVPMTPVKRWVLVTICLLLAIIGAVLIQRQHNWNPFAPCPSCKNDGGAVSSLRYSQDRGSQDLMYCYDSEPLDV